MIVWNFLLGSFLGYCSETIEFYIECGHFVSRQGVIYGPFNQIYGFGFVICLLFLYRLKDKRAYVIFLISVVVGTIFEYASSIFLEKVAGYMSWSYRNYPLNVEVRICIPVSLAWGLAGVIYIKFLFPYICKQINRLNKRLIKAVLIVFFVFMVFDLLLSTAAVERMRERERGLPAGNKCDVLLDKYYPDEKLRQIYTSVRFVN